MGRISRGVAISERGYVCFAAVALVDSSISQSCHGGASLHVQLSPITWSAEHSRLSEASYFITEQHDFMLPTYP